MDLPSPSPEPIFKNAVIYLPSSFAELRRGQLQNLIEKHAGTVTSAPKDATLVVTNSHHFEGWQDFEGDDSRPVCTELWLERSAILNRFLPTSPFSPDPSKLFSGVIGCAADLSPSDIGILSAGISSLGGQWRTGLTKDVTHLFTLGTDSEKYQSALNYKAQLPGTISILLPHWFDDVIRLGMPKLDVAPYEWPNPIVLQPSTSLNTSDKKKFNELEPNRKSLFSTAGLDAATAATKISPKQVFGGRKVLLGTTLELGTRRKTIETIVERAGGDIVPLEGDADAQEEAEKVSECAIFITRYRHGPAYFTAAKERKTIASLAWVFHVLCNGTLTPPLDQLLHYPIPKKPIEGFEKQRITITNFTGDAREYLKQLIILMGAEFTPSMSSKNTVLIAARVDGTKTDKARSWDIPIVNHLWLEDCFVKWKNMTVGLDRYIHFPRGSDLAPRLGERGLDKDTEDPAELDRLAEELEEEAEKERIKEESPSHSGPFRTQDSTRDAQEAADIVMTVNENEGSNAMEVDPNSEPETPTAKILRTPTSVVGSKPNSSLRIRRNSHVSRPPAKGNEGPGISAPGSSQRSPMRLSNRRSRILESEDILMEGTSGKENERDNIPEKVVSLKKRGEAREQEKKPITNGRSRNTHNVNLDPQSDDDYDVDIPPPRARRLRPKPNKASAEMKQVEIDSDAEIDANESRRENGSGSERDDGTRSLKKSKASTRAMGKGKAPRKDDVESEDSPQDEDDSPASAKALAERHKGPSPKKMEVVINGKPKTSDPSSSGPRALTKFESIHLASSERATPSSPRNNQSGPPSVVRPSRRAAERASQQLRDTVMPDVVSYEAEMKKRRRQSSSSVSVLPRDKDEGEDDDHIVEAKGLRQSKPKPKPKEEGPSVGMKRKASVKDEPGSKVASASPLKRARKPKAGSIRVMTTQISLGDETKKALEKLGVKLVTKPSECTHLIAPKILRTEKFLCALAVSPWILTEQWLYDSIKTNALLAEEPYLLQDKGKWNIDLKKTLESVKKAKHPLFANRIFYVTPGVFNNSTMTPELLGNVISAFGGKMVLGVPADRHLRVPMRHLVTTKADEDSWKHLTAKHYIHNVELVLQGVLRQDLACDNPEFHIEGTYESRGDDEDEE
ncbi:hypothetical protein GYMLUDRAFT_37329 [Collybiopsis luxurians FD-317 M1]|nr:hypothetical protein GYMLUDRAFT_37329 [Collybiopsis luxurians FD-317 M1]